MNHTTMPTPPSGAKSHDDNDDITARSSRGWAARDVVTNYRAAFDDLEETALHPGVVEMAQNLLAETGRRLRGKAYFGETDYAAHIIEVCHAVIVAGGVIAREREHATGQTFEDHELVDPAELARLRAASAELEALKNQTGSRTGMAPDSPVSCSVPATRRRGLRVVPKSKGARRAS